MPQSAVNKFCHLDTNHHHTTLHRTPPPSSITNLDRPSQSSIFSSLYFSSSLLSLLYRSPLVLTVRIAVPWASSKFSSSSLTATVSHLQLARYNLFTSWHLIITSIFVSLLPLNRTSCDSICKGQVRFVAMGNSSRIILSKGNLPHLFQSDAYRQDFNRGEFYEIPYNLTLILMLTIQAEARFQ